VRTRVSDATMRYLFPAGKGGSCPAEAELLRPFVLNRPSDFAFLEPSDLLDLGRSGCAGGPEWDDFAQHYASCGRCHG
jgi:hypothetical protein